MKRFILLILVLLLCSGCSSSPEEKLKGIWKHDDTYIEFNGDGTVYFTIFVDAKKRDVTFLSDEAMSIDDVVYKFSVKKNELIINETDKFIKVENDDNFNNYLNISSSSSDYKKEIDYSTIKDVFDSMGYLNYINEYFKITNIPTEDTGIISDSSKVDLICQVVNKYNNGIQMNDRNCFVTKED